MLSVISWLWSHWLVPTHWTTDCGSFWMSPSFWVNIRDFLILLQEASSQFMPIPHRHKLQPRSKNNVKLKSMWERLWWPEKKRNCLCTASDGFSVAISFKKSVISQKATVSYSSRTNLVDPLTPGSSEHWTNLWSFPSTGLFRTSFPVRG